MALPFEDILTKLDGQKRDLLSRIDGWPPELLNQRPTPEDWSVLEVLDHIVKSEVAILSAARIGLANPHGINIGDKVRTIFLQKIFASDRKVRVPATARAVLPGSGLQVEEIRKRWSDSREELNIFASGDSSGLLSKGIFRHPVGGWMGMQQILEFFSAHLVHHGYQLDRMAGSDAAIRRE